ncbi:hypothetical protein DMB44_04735 [Thermoplasma sp. Kam2015]|uniref:hypothetical protein n=1 Tax=Thermoplasma sp. Kam2015 TaxID=2094122 RepID=UPI000D8B69C9|nr:hypothetical protein [Thermoplasma sp. Kam2015]PYB68353.1 hypothetical protein DMB44_04735 [Thermoplasma sp. Kam2015]
MIKISLIFVPAYIVSFVIFSLILVFMVRMNPFRLVFYRFKIPRIRYQNQFSSEIEKTKGPLQFDLLMYRISTNGLYSKAIKNGLTYTIIRHWKKFTHVDYARYKIIDYYYLFIIFYSISMWFLVFLLLVPYGKLGSVLPKWDPTINYALLIALTISLLESSILYVSLIYSGLSSFIMTSSTSVLVVNFITLLPALQWMYGLPLTLRIMYQIIISVIAVAISFIVYNLKDMNYRYVLFAYLSTISYSSFAIVLLYSITTKVMAVIH